MADDDARPTPYDLVFGIESIDDRLFPPIAEEAETREAPLHDPDRFLFLTSVGELLRSIAGGGAAPEEQGIEGDELKQYGRLLYHAFHFWRGGRRTTTVDGERLRWLLEEVTSVGDWRLVAPAGAGYLRLPRNLVWAAPALDMAPEPVDGFFWTLVEDAEPRAFHVLLALGVREGRAGFSVVPATGLLDDEPHWVEIDARPGGTDFETTLPGGELEDLYSVQSAAEVLKLASLCFWELDPASG